MAAIPLPISAAQQLKRTLSLWLFKQQQQSSELTDSAPPELSSVFFAIQNKQPSLAVRRSQRRINICPPPFPSDLDETIRTDNSLESPSLPVDSALARRRELKQLQLKDLAIRAASPPNSSAAVEEYVHRQRLAKCTGNRDQRFPVAGNNMRPICVGSGYAYA